jgi:MYXO-CTERM domain-containing protein
VCCDAACAGNCQACTAAHGASADGTCATVAAHNAGRGQCGLYVCGGGTDCPTICTTDADCTGGGTSGVYCVNHECKGSLPLGLGCTADAQCGSGHCADGVCCDSACTGDCKACNEPGQHGTCSLTPTPRGSDCAGESVCHGACVGTSAADARCDYPSRTQGCGLCLACDGHGHCEETPASGQDPSCAAAACDTLEHGECWRYEAPGQTACDAPGICRPPMEACMVRALDDETPCAGGVCQAGLCMTKTAAPPATGCAYAAGPRAADDAASAFAVFALLMFAAWRRRRA